MKPAGPHDPSNSRVKPAPEGRKDDAGAPSPQGAPADEAGLLTRCRAGDTGAFRILVERYQHRAFGIAFRIVRSRPDAEEIAQDAFVKAWLGVKEFRGDAAFSTWLYRIVAHRALDRVETLKSRRAREEPLEDAVAVAASVDHARPGPDSRRIARLMESLPRRATHRGRAILFRGAVGGRDRASLEDARRDREDESVARAGRAPEGMGAGRAFGGFG